MVLATHAIIGATIASVIPTDPVAGFVLAFVSHFAVDAIPHWHYHLSSMSKNDRDPLEADMHIDRRNFPRDLAKICFDGLLGLTLSLVIIGFPHPVLVPAVLIGAFAAMLPDALQFVYFKWRHEPLTTLQRFHLWIHSKIDLDDTGAKGVTYQVAISLVCFLFFEVGLAV